MAVQVVVFELGQEEYAIPIDIVQEIASLREVWAVPNAPSYVRGLIDIRGMAVPLIDLHVRFGIEPKKVTMGGPDSKEDQNAFALITNVHGQYVGLAVDQLREVRILENIVPPPPVVQAPFIGGVVNLPDRIIIQIVPEHILERDEVQGLTHLSSL